MDQTQVQQNIALYYSRLPQKAQMAFSDLNWVETIRNIAKKYSLKTNQINTLSTETTMVLLGAISTSEYEKVLGEEILIPEMSFKQMMLEINSDIINQVKSDLSEAYEQNKKESSEVGGNITMDPRLENLPKDLQNAISSSGYQQKLYEIGTKYKLQVSKMDPLETITIKLITGKIMPSQYENEISTELDLPAEKARELANDVNENIFKDIRGQMKKQTGEYEENTDDIVPPPPYSQNSNNEEASVPVPEYTLPEATHSEYEDTGIEIMKEDTTPLTEAINNTVFKSDINIFKEKLDGITTSKNKVTDYSLPKMGNVIIKEKMPLAQALPIEQNSQNLQGLRHDPYHEAI